MPDLPAASRRVTRDGAVPPDGAVATEPAIAQTVETPIGVAPFAPLRHRDFRLLWSGLIISNTGSWIQFTTLGYLMDQLTLNAIYLGLLGVSVAIPRLLFAFIGGVVADRVDRRRVLLTTNLISMATAALLAALTALDLIQVWHLLAIGAFNSLVHSFDMPARHSLTPALVERHELLQAVSLNSMAFNGAGIFGPALGGLIISLVGTPGAFAVNAASYLGVVWALVAMSVPPQVREGRVSFSEDVREGLALVVRSRAVLLVLVMVAAVSFFGRPYIRLMPAVAREVLHVGPRGWGLLQAAPGLGTIIAVFLIGWSARRVRPGTLLLGAAIAMGAVVTLFGLSTSFPLSVALLIAVGLGQSVSLATANSALQTTVPPAARGRAMGLFGTVAFGMMALGTLPIGALAGVIGLSWSIALAGGALIGVMLVLAFAGPGLRTLDLSSGTPDPPLRPDPAAET